MHTRNLCSVHFDYLTILIISYYTRDNDNFTRSISWIFKFNYKFMNTTKFNKVLLHDTIVLASPKTGLYMYIVLKSATGGCIY